MTPVPARSLMRSPMQMGDSPAAMAQVMQGIRELAKMHATFLQNVEKLEARLAQIQRGERGPTGPAGMGIEGPAGRDGKDGRGFDEQTARRMIKKLMPRVKDGKDAQPIPREEIVGMIFDEMISGRRKLHVGHVEGFEQTLSPIRRMIANLGMRGGGDTVVAGTGVTITNTRNGNKEISAPGAGISVIAVAGSINDSNVSFTAASQPTLLNVNGQFYQKTGGNITWSYAAGTITLSSPVGTGGSIFGI